MTSLRQDDLTLIRLNLRGGAVINMRPLTRALLTDVQRQCADKLCQLVSGDLRTIRELALIHPIFRNIGPMGAWVEEAMFVLFPIELALAVTTSWEAVFDESGTSIQRPDRVSIAQLLQDPRDRDHFMVGVGMEIDRILRAPMENF